MTISDTAGNESIYKHYLIDLCRLVKDNALEARREKQLATDSDGQLFEAGRLMAYHEVISLMQQQAKSFGLPLAIIGLDDIDPEKDLL
jgi:hypothetical protein